MTRIVTIAVPPERVWSCITEPAHLAAWLGDIAAFPDGTAPGAMGRFAWSGEVVLAARVLESEPCERFSFEWSEGVLGPKSSTVTFSMRPSDLGTLVHFEETGFSFSGDETSVRASLRSLAQGWTVELDELVAYAERSAPEAPAA